jgi:hypothetical protein
MYRLTSKAREIRITQQAWSRASLGTADSLDEENTLAWDYIQYSILGSGHLISTLRVVEYFRCWSVGELIPRRQRANAYAIRRPQQVIDRLEECGLIERVRGGVMPTYHT